MAMPHRSDRYEQEALFWCSLLEPLVCGEIPPEEAAEFLRELANTEQLFPDGQRKKPSRSTLWRKWKQYREGGFEALVRRRRSDRGKARKGRQAMIDRAVELKKDQPRRSEETINQFLQHEFQDTLPKSTLYRHLKKAGATRLKLGVSKQKVRRRWTRDQSNALWVGDFADGPYVIDGDRAKETHLCAFIDCHSRYAVDARYYYRENLEVLIDSLLRAWANHGASRELYVDNAKIYHANALKTACLALNIKLLHRAPRDPPGGGLVERFIETAQGQFESEVRAGEILTLEKLNQAFSAWREVSYHERTHSETGQSPRLRYEAGKSFTRHVDLQRVLKFFLKSETRRVDFDFSDVRLLGRFFLVDKGLRGDKVEVRYDPFGELESVLLYSLDGEYLGTGTRHTREGTDDSTEAHSASPSPVAKAKYNYLDLLIEKQRQAIDRHAASGIDYRAVLAAADRRWPFVEFAKQLASHLGRSGGLSTFRTDELESLQKVYQRLTFLDPALLETACAQAQQRSIPEIVFLLQRLHDERRT
jgi:transposase InsO family protein